MTLKEELQRLKGQHINVGALVAVGLSETDVGQLLFLDTQEEVDAWVQTKKELLGLVHASITTVVTTKVGTGLTTAKTASAGAKKPPKMSSSSIASTSAINREKTARNTKSGVAAAKTASKTNEKTKSAIVPTKNTRSSKHTAAATTPITTATATSTSTPATAATDSKVTTVTAATDSKVTTAATDMPSATAATTATLAPDQPAGVAMATERAAEAEPRSAAVDTAHPPSGERDGGSEGRADDDARERTGGEETVDGGGEYEDKRETDGAGTATVDPQNRIYIQEASQWPCVQLCNWLVANGVDVQLVQRFYDLEINGRFFLDNISEVVMKRENWSDDQIRLVMGLKKYLSAQVVPVSVGCSLCGGTYTVVAVAGSASAHSFHFTAIDRTTSEMVSIRAFASCVGDPKALEQLPHHSHVSAVLASFVESGYVFLVSEHVPGSTVRRLVEHGVRFSETQAVRFAYEIATALSHLHCGGFVHRAVTVDNVVICANGGRCKVLFFDVPDTTTIDGTDSEVSDSCGLGRVLYTMLTASDFPADGVLADTVPPKLVPLIRALTHASPTCRMSCATACAEFARVLEITKRRLYHCFVCYDTAQYPLVSSLCAFASTRAIDGDDKIVPYWDLHGNKHECWAVDWVKPMLVARSCLLVVAQEPTEALKALATDSLCHRWLLQTSVLLHLLKIRRITAVLPVFVGSTLSLDPSTVYTPAPHEFPAVAPAATAAAWVRVLATVDVLVQDTDFPTVAHIVEQVCSLPGACAYGSGCDAPTDAINKLLDRLVQLALTPEELASMTMLDVVMPPSVQALNHDHATASERPITSTHVVGQSESKPVVTPVATPSASVVEQTQTKPEPVATPVSSPAATAVEATQAKPWPASPPAPATPVTHTAEQPPSQLEPDLTSPYSSSARSSEYSGTPFSQQSVFLKGDHPAIPGVSPDERANTSSSCSITGMPNALNELAGLRRGELFHVTDQAEVLNLDDLSTAGSSSYSDSDDDYDDGDRLDEMFTKFVVGDMGGYTSEPASQPETDQPDPEGPNPMMQLLPPQQREVSFDMPVRNQSLQPRKLKTPINFTPIPPLVIEEDEYLKGKRLWVAADNMDVRMVQKQLDKGALVDWTDEAGWTPLHRAARNNAADVVQLLLSAGADVNRQDLQGWTPVFWAVEKNAIPSLKVLLSAGGSVDTMIRSGWTCLHFAAQASLPAVDLVLSAGASVNAAKQGGRTPLDVACLHGNVAIVQRLLNAGADKGMMQIKLPAPGKKSRFSKEVVKLLR